MNGGKDTRGEKQVLERHTEVLPSTASTRMEKTSMFQAGGEAGESGRAPLKTAVGQGSHTGHK